MDEPLDRIIVLQIQAAFQSGYRKCLENYGKAKPYMSLSQFQTQYGKGISQKWIDAGLVKLVRHGKNTSKWFISVAEAEKVATAYHPELICNNKNEE